MIENYFKIAIRRFQSHRINAIVNLLGLVVGITSALIILSIIKFELSFDRFHSDSNRIYRIVRISQVGGQEEFRPTVPYPLPIAVGNEISSIEKITSIVYWNWSGIQLELIDGPVEKQTKFNESSGFAFVEPSFFEIFDFKETGFKWLSGNPETALVESKSLVLTRSIANKYFGDINVLGRSLRVDEVWDGIITGVIEDFPSNTDFPFTILMSYSTLLQSVGEGANDWVSIGETECFVKLPSWITKDEMNKNIAKVHSSHTTKELNEARKYLLQDISEVHRDGRFGNYNNRIVSEKKLWALAIIGLFLLITACINYINLATAQSTLRSKEIGIRKVLGGSTSQLTRQFMSEAFTLVFTASLLGLLSAELLISNFQALLSTATSTHLIFDFFILKSLVVILLFLTFFAGLYPAFIMSRFNPLMAIKNKLTSTKGGISLRRILIILQFSITQIFVIGTFVVVVQMNYFAHVDLGFSIEAIVNVDLPDFDRRKLRLFEKKVHSEPSIESVSFSSSIPSGLKRPRSFTGIKKKGADTNEGVLTEFQFIDPLYLNLYKMEIVAGRNFSFSDSLNFIIINEALTKKIGFNIPKDALDTQMILGGRQVTVIGVIKDYHSKSLHEEIDHVTFLYVPYRFSTASIKLFQAGSQGASPAQDKIEVIKKAWQVAYPESTFSYHFFDKNIESFYVEEYKFSTLLQIFSLVLIFIGCLGLYGLISFMVNRRMGEVAVRKVFGASSAGIMKLLSKDFVTMLAIAFLIAAPVSYYFMDIWLQGFAYHIAMKWWMFILPASTVLLIAFLSVSGQSLRAARCNPAETLKAE